MKENANSSLTCLIVDDEPKAQKVLLKLISEMSWLETAGCASDVPMALRMIVERKPDVIFLDIQMPGLTGLDLLKSLPTPTPHVVIVSAHKQYAFDAFDFEVADFLLKPVSPQRFLKTILKLSLKNQRTLPSIGEEQYVSLSGAIRNPSNAETSLTTGHSWLKAGGKIHRIAQRQIYTIKACGDYVKIHYAEGMLLVRDSIGKMEEALPKSDFVRIHRSTIVNRHAVKMIEGNTIKMIDESEHIIAVRMNREAILKQLTNL